jgi:hypothetical protein
MHTGGHNRPPRECTGIDQSPSSQPTRGD